MRSSIWKNAAFWGAIIAAVIGGIFLLISTLISSTPSTSRQEDAASKDSNIVRGDASPVTVPPDNSPVTVIQDSDSSTIHQESKGNHSPNIIATDGGTVNYNRPAD